MEDGDGDGDGDEDEDEDERMGEAGKLVIGEEESEELEGELAAHTRGIVLPFISRDRLIWRIQLCMTCSDSATSLNDRPFAALFFRMKQFLV